MNKNIEYFGYKALFEFWFGLFLIDSTGSEAKIQVATCDHIQNPKFPNLVFDSTLVSFITTTSSLSKQLFYKLTIFIVGLMEYIAGG